MHKTDITFVINFFLISTFFFPPNSQVNIRKMNSWKVPGVY